MSDENVILEVRRDDVGETQLVEERAVDPEHGQVRVEVERFALTANNITYAVAGDMLGYWDFYPTDLPWGRVPAMGWARVVESAHSDVAVGSRYYGWFPMAKYVTTTVAVTDDGLRDDGAHRLAHAPVYRAWVDTTKDPLHQDGAEAEDRHALLRGSSSLAISPTRRSPPTTTTVRARCWSRRHRRRRRSRSPTMPAAATAFGRSASRRRRTRRSWKDSRSTTTSSCTTPSTGYRKTTPC